MEGSWSVGGGRKAQEQAGERGVWEARGPAGGTVAEPASHRPRDDQPARPVAAVAGGAASRCLCLIEPPAPVRRPAGDRAVAARYRARYSPPRKSSRSVPRCARSRARAGMCRKLPGAARTA